MIKIPALTQDRRTEITKKIKIIGEDTKAQIRQIRQDAMKTTKKLLDDKEISEDENKTKSELESAKSDLEKLYQEVAQKVAQEKQQTQQTNNTQQKADDDDVIEAEVE